MSSPHVRSHPARRPSFFGHLFILFLPVSLLLALPTAHGADSGPSFTVEEATITTIHEANIGFNTRTGPITRTVEDAARVLTVIAGYDPKDEMTAFAVGRLPSDPYETFTSATSLHGVRIGVLRQYMDRAVFSEPIYTPAIDAAERAIADLKNSVPRSWSPDPRGCSPNILSAIIQCCRIRRGRNYFPSYFQSIPAVNPSAIILRRSSSSRWSPLKCHEKSRCATSRAALAAAVPSAKAVSATISILHNAATPIFARSTISLPRPGSSPTTRNRSRKLRSKTRTLRKPTKPAQRLQRRFAVQQIVLQCMAELKLDALVYPTSNIPPRKIGLPRDPSFNGIGNYGMWTFLGTQGFPAMTIPAGFTTEVWDRVPIDATPSAKTAPDTSSPRSPPATRLVGPIAAKLPIGVDFLGRPFSEPLLFKIAAAYEKATKHRQPPAAFGPLHTPPPGTTQ